MREDIIAHWLSGTEWSDWRRSKLAGDASTRSYHRLSKDTHSVILMDAPPADCGSQRPFVEMANHLRGLGLSTPDVLAWDDALGLMIISDLGPSDYARHLASHPDDERRLYSHAAQVLARLSYAPAPRGLVSMTPEVGTDMIGLAFEWAATDANLDLKSEIEAALRALLFTVSLDPSTLSLRDFHAENLIWRPDQTGLEKVGLLDFQDAFITHPAYDVASLLRDARRDVQHDLIDDLLAIVMPSEPAEERRLAFHVMAVQRNLRILGIFHRLARTRNKPQYLDLVPRVWAHLMADLDTPALAGLRPLVIRAFRERPSP